VRFIWIYQFQDVESFKYAGQFMINTNDGYYWAEGARDLLQGYHQPHDLSPVNEAPSQLTYVLSKILPISFETLIFYMPSVIGSLIVVPILLIAYNLGIVEVGFLAALLASIAVSYYNRTMVGYYDTDMLTIVFPTLLLWSLILAVRTKEEKYLLITALEIIAYRWWYPGSYSLEFSYLGLLLIYALLFDRQERFYLKLVAMMLFAMVGLPGWLRFIMVVVVYGIFKYRKISKFVWYLLGASIVLFFVTGGFAPIWAQLKGYVFKEALEVTHDQLSLHFFSVNQTIREAGQIPFSVFAERISGHWITLVFSLVGYALMAWRYRVMLLALPMLGLGFLALFGGLRFTIYAVPVCALGIAYFIFTCSVSIPRLFANERLGHIVKSAFVVLSSIGILYPNILHVIEYRVPTVFNKMEVEQLTALKTLSNREDYVISWWDYGYPIRYYADVKTLIDGGKHSGDVNFPVSYMLTSAQESAAKLARLEVEYTEKAAVLAETNQSTMNNTAQMTLDYGFHDANDFLTALQTPLTLPQKTRDIYFYLPFRMLSIFPTVAEFSNIDLMSGNINRRPFLFESNQFQDDGKRLNLGSGVSLDKERGMLSLGAKEVPVKSFIQTAYNPQNQLIKNQQTIHQNGHLNIVYMQAYHTFLILDDTMLNSSYIQLFVLENYDARFFEPIRLDAYAKIYRLKI
jgi:dolichyl-diphosphooligosaccharide--protein glycosyltransferase/undecaprenyl-diphosphooligosaccharide--protein glycosyltransferase